MLAKVCSAAVNGIEAYPVEVEVNAGYGDTIIVIVVNKTPQEAFGQFWAAFIELPALPNRQRLPNWQTARFFLSGPVPQGQEQGTEPPPAA